MPVLGDDGLFERLSLEAFQSGLSWLTILRKREAFREAFAGFRIREVAGFGARDVKRLMADAGIVRNRRKIDAAIRTPARRSALAEEGESLSSARVVVPARRRHRAPRLGGRLPATTAESAALSKELKARGFRFVGPDHRLRADAGLRAGQRPSSRAARCGARSRTCSARLSDPLRSNALSRICSPRDEAGGKERAGHRRREGDRRGDRASAERGGRAGDDRGHRRRAGRRGGVRRWAPRSSHSTSPTPTRPRRPSTRRRARRARQQRGHRRVRLLHRHRPGLWERVIAVNLKGVLACTHAALPGMQQAGYGRIVNIASEAGRVGLEGLGCVLGGEGRRDRVHEDDRPRERPLRDHRQRDRPRPDRHAAASPRQRARGARRARSSRR